MMNLEKLGLSLEDVLQRSQLVSISGGIGPGDPALDDGGSGECFYSYCHCHDSPGAWEGCYASNQERREAVEMYCSSGAGYCM